MKQISSLPDQNLLELVAGGHVGAYTEIYNRYWQKLLAIAYNHTKDKTAAEEIVQEIFIDLWKRRGTVEIISLDRYLATAVKFAVFKTYYRARKRQLALLTNIKTPDIDAADEKIYARFLQDYINGIVEQLPEKCKLVFKYSREAGMSIPEISREMLIAEKTVEAHLTKALKTIRLSLEESGALTIVAAVLLTMP